MSHIVESCPQTRLHGGLSKLHSADDEPGWPVMAPNAYDNNNYNHTIDLYFFIALLHLPLYLCIMLLSLCKGHLISYHDDDDDDRPIH